MGASGHESVQRGDYRSMICLEGTQMLRERTQYHYGSITCALLTTRISGVCTTLEPYHLLETTATVNQWTYHMSLVLHIYFHIHFYNQYPHLPYRDNVSVAQSSVQRQGSVEFDNLLGTSN